MAISASSSLRDIKLQNRHIRRLYDARRKPQAFFPVFSREYGQDFTVICFVSNKRIVPP